MAPYAPAEGLAALSVFGALLAASQIYYLYHVIRAHLKTQYAQGR
ncbi:hypothetical protein [Pyrobaculum aerophilum]|nr:hypothetical protein [Pyrobaculum aerophilum]